MKINNYTREYSKASAKGTKTRQGRDGNRVEIVQTSLNRPVFENKRENVFENK